MKDETVKEVVSRGNEAVLASVERDLQNHPYFDRVCAAGRWFGVDIDRDKVEKETIKDVTALRTVYPKLKDSYSNELLAMGSYYLGSHASGQPYRSEEFRANMAQVGKVEQKDYFIVPGREHEQSLRVFSPGFLASNTVANEHLSY